MPLFGAHMSIAGGCHKALQAALDFGCETLQLFTKSNNQWAGKPLTEEDLERFHSLLKVSQLQFPTAHDSYLINLASPDEVLFQKSIDAFTHEIERAEALGLNYLVMHPGAHVGSGEEAGLERIVQGLDESHRRTVGCKVQVLLETTAGQGTTLGHRFEHLSTILERVAQPNRLGVCFDTCHVFAAGYPLAPVELYQETWGEFDHLIGIARVKVFHMNDSKKPFGSRVDRHEQIGAGYLGIEPFRLLVNDLRFQNHPMILETPKEGPNGEIMDPINLKTLRELWTLASNKTSKATPLIKTALKAKTPKKNPAPSPRRGN